MQLLYTCQAVNDLKRLRHFITKENPKIASEISKQITEAIKRLVDFPLLGRKVKHANDYFDSMYELVTNKYIARYILLNEEIHILRIWHSKEYKSSRYI